MIVGAVILTRPMLKIITLYEPNSTLWDGFRLRRSRDR